MLALSVQTPEADLITRELDQAETKAWDAIRRYKFQMFVVPSGRIHRR